MYADKDRRLNSATQAMQEYEQLPNESVRVYANRLKANWRRAGWNLKTHEVVLYDMACADVRHALKTKVRPWISSSKDRFDTFDQLFNWAAASEFKPDDKKPGGQQQQQRQAGESQKGGEKKHNFRPSIAEPAENTSGNSNSSGTGNSKSVKSNKPSRGSHVNYIQRRGIQSKSTKAEWQTGNALAAAVETTIAYLQPTLDEIQPHRVA